MVGASADDFTSPAMWPMAIFIICGNLGPSTGIVVDVGVYVDGATDEVDGSTGGVDGPLSALADGSGPADGLIARPHPTSETKSKDAKAALPAPRYQCFM